MRISYHTLVKHSVCSKLTLGLVACSHSAAIQNHEEMPDYLTRAAKEIGAPGLSVLAIRDGETVLQATRGHRKANVDSPLELSDRFHLGSNTKAMTALLVARLVDVGVVRWDETLKELLPSVEMRPNYTSVTVQDLLRHEGGLPGYLARSKRTLWNALWDAYADDVVATRAMLTRALLMEEPSAGQGTYLYSNSGYVILASALESRTGKRWESLIEEQIFQPLGMTGCRFGSPAQSAAGVPREPWGHRKRVDGSLKPMKPGPIADNPPAIAPAGGVHCDMVSWQRFTEVFLRPIETLSIVKPETMRGLLTPSEGGRYSGGWRRVYREWGDGLVLYHAGTNKRFYSVAWLAPEKGSMVLAAVNLYYDGIEGKVDALVGSLIRRFIQDHYALLN